MKTRLFVLAMAAAAMFPRSGAAQAGPMDAVHRFVAAFNKGDVPAAASACAPETSIIDEFAPYEWHGAGACARWMGDTMPTRSGMASPEASSPSARRGTSTSPATARTSWSPRTTPTRRRARR